MLRTPDAEARGRRIEAALLFPCALAPLGVLAPWVVAPSHVGIGVGNFGFFLHWMTRYPNLGPINGEVLLGMGAVLGASTMPSLLAAHAWFAHPSRARTTAVLVLLHLVAYVPVLLRLDVGLFAYARLVATDGPVSLLSSGWSAFSAASFAGGAILRAFTTLCALTFAVRGGRL